MKAAVVLCAFLACAASLPAKNSSSNGTNDEVDEEVYSVFLTPVRSEVDDDDSSSSESSERTPHPYGSFNPFRFFFNPVPFFRFPSFPPVPNFGTVFSLKPSSDPDTKLLNSTLETKIINGHKMVVNNSYYENKKTNAIIHTVSYTFGENEDDEATKPPVPTPDITDPSVYGKSASDNDLSSEQLADHTDDKGDTLVA